MEWTTELYERIRRLLPKQRGNVDIDQLTFLQALQYIAENGCRWRAVPEKFGNWNRKYHHLHEKLVPTRPSISRGSTFICILGWNPIENNGICFNIRNEQERNGEGESDEVIS